MDQYFEALRMLESLASRNVSEHIGKPKRVEFVMDTDGRQIAYFNWTSATGQTTGDVAAFIRVLPVLPDEVADAFICRSNTPNHRAPPAPMFEVWVQDALMSSDITFVKDQLVYFLRDKAGRNVIVRLVDGAHPELKGVFGETADSAIASSKSYSVAAAASLN